MSPTVSNACASAEVRSSDREVRAIDRVRPEAAKAQLASDRVGPTFRSVMKRAILAHYGTVKETAFALGEVDESLMQREFEAGKFGRFDDHANEGAKAYVARELRRTFGDVDTKATARRMIEDLRVRLDDIAEVLR